MKAVGDIEEGWQLREVGIRGEGLGVMDKDGKMAEWELSVEEKVRQKGDREDGEIS